MNSEVEIRWRALAGQAVHGLAQQVGVTGVPRVLLDHVQKHLPHAGGTPVPPSELRRAVQALLSQHDGYYIAGPLHGGPP